MTRARPLLALLAALTVLLLAVPPGFATPVADADEGPALSVEITSLSPVAIPRHGPITVDGVVRNQSDQAWTTLNVYPLTSYQPMTSRAEVEAAAVTDPDTTDFGERLLDRGVNVGDLAPGASTTFHLRVPRRALNISGAPGVYWIGVHVLGVSTAPRDNIADGRARTFIPLLPAEPRRKRAKVSQVAKAAKVSVVVPVRAPVRRASDGSLQRVAALAHSLAPSGRLGRLLTWAQQNPGLPLTWLVDPAVLDAAHAIAEGDPPLDLGQARPGGPSGSPSPSGSASSDSNADARAPQLTDADRKNAAEWLRTVTTLLRGTRPLALPYADPDVSALATTEPRLLDRALALSRTAMSARHIPASSAVAPTDGYLDPAVVDLLPERVTVLVADHGRPPRGSSAQEVAGRRFVYTDTRTSSGGPLPEPRLGALNLRQRIASDAALGVLAHSRRTTIVALPPDWDPDTDADTGTFFTGLDQRWLTVVPLPNGDPPPTSSTTPSTTPTTTPRLAWPPAALRAEVPALNSHVAAELVGTGTVLDHLLDTDNDVEATLSAAALSAVSYDARKDPVVARIRAGNLDRTVQQLMADVKVLGTDFVTLSGGSGYLTVSVVNGLDAPVRVGLRARTGSPKIRIDPSKPVTLAAGQRSTVRLHAHAGVIGVHEVSLVPVTGHGEPLGTPLVFSLRTSQVGTVFWGILAGCFVILVVLVLRQVRRRLRTGERHP